MLFKYNRLLSLLLIIVLLNIQISEAKEIVYIASYTAGGMSKEEFMQNYAGFYANLKYEKIEDYPFSFIMQPKYDGKYVDAYEVDGTQVDIFLGVCRREHGGCAFRINGIATDWFKPSTDETEYLFDFGNGYAMKIESILFDYCGGRFCDYKELYDVVNITIKRTAPIVCGDNKCEVDENPNSCPLDCPPVCGDGLCSDNENCKKDNCCDGDEVNLRTDVENCGGCGLACKNHEQCKNGKCIPVCGDGYCIEGETCLLDACCDGNEINLDNDPFNCGGCGFICSNDEECNNGKCIIKDVCGDSICGSTETCGSCVKDCGCKEKHECFKDQCIKSACLANSDCDDNNACTIDSCSGKPKACFNEQIKLGCSINNECVPVSTRINNLYYCNADNAIGIMETTNSSCAYDYQCQTNLCKENKCKQPNMIIRMLNWFKNLF